MVNDILSRLPLCIEYSKNAYIVPQDYDQLIERLRSLGTNAEQSTDLM